jgi:hypothetical protein
MCRDDWSGLSLLHGPAGQVQALLHGHDLLPESFVGKPMLAGVVPQTQLVELGDSAQADHARVQRPHVGRIEREANLDGSRLRAHRKTIPPYKKL